MRLFTWILLFALVLVLGNSRSLDARTSDSTPMTTLQTEMGEKGGKDWNVIAVELAPGAMNRWHSQPGGEFLYVLEGAGRLEADGKQAITLNPGSVSTLTSIPHHVLKNISRTKPLKILVVFLNPSGGPHPLLASGLVQGDDGRRDTPLPGESQAGTGRQKAGDIGLVF
jgi:quercetin dioxygenase-like cupin family protein